MKGYVFDPSRLARSPKQQERDGYAVAGRMLRDYLGGDIFAEVRERAERDPQLRAMFREIRGLLAPAAEHADKASASCPRGLRRVR
jgi:hypothetical protein